MSTIQTESVTHSDLFTESLKFWFNDHGHIRSPFPEYLQDDLEKEASLRFAKWVQNVNPNAKEEVNDLTLSEKLDEIIFEEGLKLAKDEDEKISIRYPFLPRIGDQINTDSGVSATIVDRSLVREGDNSYLNVVMEEVGSPVRSEVRFELPV